LRRGADAERLQTYEPTGHRRDWLGLGRRVVDLVHARHLDGHRCRVDGTAQQVLRQVAVHRLLIGILELQDEVVQRDVLVGAGIGGVEVGSADARRADQLIRRRPVAARLVTVAAVVAS
jgi:hypothetical protein